MADPKEFTEFIDALDRAGIHVPRRIASEIWNMLSAKEANTIDRCEQLIEASPNLAVAKEALKMFKAGVAYVKA